ncbi:MAG TPA: M48 family metallopeptidase [Desulfomonilia bacterium]
MQKSVIYIPIFIICVFLNGCATAPITGRSQLLLVPESDEIALGLKSYQEVLAKAKISRDQQVNAQVKRVGTRIASVADREDYSWEFTVIDDPKTANAFALPGGKVAVFTGILPYTKDDNGLAFVLAHEVGHAIARHGGERMSEQLLIQLGQQGLNLAIADKSPQAIQAINLGYGLGTTVGVTLPFSRAQELEADYIGIILMAKAGYDPREAPKFFERMTSGQSKKTIEFLSTHPADDRRIQNLKNLIPQALPYYKQ